MSFFEVRPTTRFVGAEVFGVHLVADLDPQAIDELRAAIHRWRVLFLTEQALAGAELLAFAQQLTPAAEVQSSVHAIDPIVDVDEWMIDGSYLADPPSTLIARCEVAPSSGIDTMWTDLVTVYQHLSSPIQRAVESLQAVHDDGHETTLHPVVRVDPLTSERSIFVNPRYTTSIAGVSRRESEAVLRILFAQISQSALTARLQWRPNTIAIWDNTTTAYRTLRYDHKDNDAWTGQVLRLHPGRPRSLDNSSELAGAALTAATRR